ncbi:hypothetical protein IR073_06490 [Gemella sp. 19428wG2_WT2a]|nr:hypothetical protein [Gemella sp. 19428wG2_WT2a]TFU57684.1 hypothetical protein E4T67_06415 [Gemella sp. WT2a]
MKTPHRIKLFKSNTADKYNPVTDTYENSESEYKEVACYINYIKKSKVFEDYGNRTDNIMICRFMQEQEPFTKAFFKNNYYVPIENIDAPIKSAVRLKRVVRNG